MTQLGCDAAALGSQLSQINPAQMKRVMLRVFLVLFSMNVIHVFAQDDHRCEADVVIERVDSIHTEQQATRSAHDPLTAFNDAEIHHKR